MLRYYVCRLFGFLLLSCSSLYAQGQYENVWAFGFNAGLDFNSGEPVGIRTAMVTSEGTAAVCDSTGQLLFYTEGGIVWNRDHQVMVNGNDLTGLGEQITTSTSQGALIVPVPGQAAQYYIFSLGSIEFRGSGRLWYSIVDMTQDGGKGAVMAGKKGILLDVELTEKMAGIEGNDCNVWLMVVPQRGNQVKAYHIGLTGIDTQAVISGIAPVSFLAVTGWMDAAPNRQKIIIANALYDFDPNTGRVTNPVVLPAAPTYGVCFSPDNSKLYCSAATTIQYDLSSNDSATIVQSGKVISQFGNTIRRGPDGKVYIPGPGQGRISVIHQPNATGMACQLAPDAVGLFEGTRTWNFPNYVPFPQDRYRERTTQTRDTVFCEAEHILEALNNNGREYLWNTGDTTTSLRIDSSGTYWVRYLVHSVCTYDIYTDTFHVYFDYGPRLAATSSSRTLLCVSDTLLLQAQNNLGEDYVWDNGLLELRRMIREPGTYWVTYRVDSLCSINADTFIVRYPEETPRVAFEMDTLACVQEVLMLANLSPEAYTEFYWNFGDGHEAITPDARHRYSREGSYQVLLVGSRNGLCADSLYKTVYIDAVVPVSFSINRYPVCVGESLLLTPSLAEQTLEHLLWNTGSGAYLHTAAVAPVPYAFDVPGNTLISLTAVFRACPDIVVSDSVFVAPLPQVYLGADMALCFEGTAFSLSNLAGGHAGDRYLWNTGAATPDIVATKPGRYVLQVTNVYGCAQSESILLQKDCYLDIPNAFTPNGDGLNDYFFPRKLLSSGVIRFQLQVLNRWGQVLYETQQVQGRGWDGRFNGQPQPDGVYVYLLECTMKDGREERYRGDVTLIR